MTRRTVGPHTPIDGAAIRRERVIPDPRRQLIAVYSRLRYHPRIHDRPLGGMFVAKATVT
jgi:hypothetical protein